MKTPPKIVNSNAGGKYVKAYSMTCEVKFTTIIKARNDDDAHRKFKDALMDSHIAVRPRQDWGVEFLNAIGEPRITTVLDTEEIHSTQINHKSRKYKNA